MIAGLQALKDMQKFTKQDKSSFAAMKISSNKR
jgi:hypothetical protein